MRLDRAEQRFALIERQLGLAAIRLKGSSEHYPKDQIYLDLTPVFVSAVGRVFKTMKATGIAFRGYDADVYMAPFTSEIVIDLNNPTFTGSCLGGDARGYFAALISN